jgi:RNA polymerase sigma-70 factor (ECF subfamily)
VIDRGVHSISQPLLETLHREAHAERWDLTLVQFARTLHASAARAAPSDLRRYLRGLHLEDLALACACAAGNERAWDHFVGEHRPALYRAADALDSSGNARELADSIYGELFGVRERDGERQSLFRYYHGRSSLKTWLRAVLAQRHVDGIRASRRLDPLPDDEGPQALATPSGGAADPRHSRYRACVQHAFKIAVSRLPDRDRLRLACYYAQRLTLAETGRLLKEHEATVSRQLTRTRQAIRNTVERHLREQDQLSAAQIAECFELVLEDPGPLDLGGILRKNSVTDRSI